MHVVGFVVCVFRLLTLRGTVYLQVFFFFFFTCSWINFLKEQFTQTSDPQSSSPLCVLMKVHKTSVVAAATESAGDLIKSEEEPEIQS